MLLEVMQAIPFSFAALFPVVNPIGSSVIVMSIAEGATAADLKTLAFKIAIFSSILLTTVLISGSWILRLFGITIPVVLIGGGLVLAYIGWQLLNQPDASPTANTDTSPSTDKVLSMAFYPLTMPVTAGPGCIAVAIALGAHSLTGDLESSAYSLLGDAIGISLVGLAIFICYRYSYTITHKLGQAGTAVIMRLAAFINLCIGLELIVHGFKVLLTTHGAI